MAGIAVLFGAFVVDLFTMNLNRFRAVFPRVHANSNRIYCYTESTKLSKLQGLVLGEFEMPGVKAAVPGSVHFESNDIQLDVNSPGVDSTSTDSASNNVAAMSVSGGLSATAITAFSLLLTSIGEPMYGGFGYSRTFFTGLFDEGRVSAQIISNNARVNCFRAGVPCHAFYFAGFKSVSILSAKVRGNSFVVTDARSDTSLSCNPNIVKGSDGNVGVFLFRVSTSYLTPTNGVSEKKAEFVFDETNTVLFNTTPSTCNQVIGGASKMAIFSFVSFNPENAATEIPLHLKISLDKVSTQVQLQPGLKMNSLFRLPTSQTKTLLLDFSVLDTSLNVRGVKEPITDSPALLGTLPSSLSSGSVIDLSTVSLEGDLSVSTPDFKRALHHCPSILSFDKTGNSPQLQSAPTCSGGAGTNKCDFKIRCLLDRCVPQASSSTNLQQLMLQTGFESAAFETASWNVETNNTDCFNPTRTLTPQQSRTSKTKTITKYVTAPIEPVEKVSETFVDSTNGLQGTNLAVSAVVSAVVPTLSFGVARQQAMLGYVTAAKSGSCRGIDESNFKPGAADSPTQMEVGTSIARYYIGGAVGNGVLTFSLVIGAEFLGVLYMKRTGSSSWNKPYKVFARCHVALVAFVFFSLLLAPTLTLGLVAVALPKSIVSVPSKFLTILFCLLFLAAALYQTIWALYIRDRVEKYKLTKMSQQERAEQGKLKKFFSYWFEGPGEWVMPHRAPSSLQRELNEKDHLDFDAANPVVDGYNNRAPWFAVAEYAVQIGLALASFLAQVVPEKVSCVTQAVVLCVALCAYLFLCLWLRPFQEKFNIIVMPVMTTIQLVIIIIVAAMGAEQPSWIESLAVFSASMQSVVAIVVLLASFGPMMKPVLRVWQNLKRRTRGGGEGRREGTARSNDTRQFHAQDAVGSSLRDLLRGDEENAEDDEVEMQVSLRQQQQRSGGRVNQQQQQQQQQQRQQVRPQQRQQPSPDNRRHQQREMYQEVPYRQSSPSSYSPRHPSSSSFSPTAAAASSSSQFHQHQSPRQQQQQQQQQQTQNNHNSSSHRFQYDNDHNDSYRSSNNNYNNSRNRRVEADTSRTSHPPRQPQQQQQQQRVFPASSSSSFHSPPRHQSPSSGNFNQQQQQQSYNRNNNQRPSSSSSSSSPSPSFSSSSTSPNSRRR